MYRILKLHNLHKKTSLDPSITNLILPFRTCSLCNKQYLPPSAGGNGCRAMSRSFNTAQHNIVLRKRKLPRTRKSLVDLLTVKSNSASEGKALVTKLTADDVSVLAGSPKITLQELYRIKGKKYLIKFHQNEKKVDFSSKSYDNCSNLRPEKVGRTIFLPTDSDTKASLLSSSFGLFMEPACSSSVVPLSSYPKPTFDLIDVKNFNLLEESLREDLKMENISNEKVKLNENGKEENEILSSKTATISKTKLKTQNPQHSTKTEKKKIRQAAWIAQYEAAKEESKNNSHFRSFESYLDVCVNTGYFRQGCRFVVGYLKKTKGMINPARDVSLFEILLNHTAKTADVVMMKSLVNLMRDYEIPLTLKCYASCLECLGRVPKLKERFTLIKILIEDMMFYKHELNDLFVKCHFVHDQREKVCHSIRALQPSFVPTAKKDGNYKQKLLSRLNDETSGNGCYTSPADRLFDDRTIEPLVQQQLEYDLSGYATIRNIYKTVNEEAVEASKSVQLKIEADWKKSVEAGFNRDLRALEQCAGQNFRLSMFLKAFSPEEFADLMLKEIRVRIGDNELFSLSAYTLYVNLGSKVKQEYDLKGMKANGQFDKLIQIYKTYNMHYLHPKKYVQKHSNPRKIWEEIESNFSEGSDLNVCSKPWPYEILYQVGKFLYSVIIRDVKIDINACKENQKPHWIPAFYTIYRKLDTNKYQEQFKMHPLVSKIYHPAGQPELLMESYTLPMVCPPKPWTSVESGGFPIVSSNFFRLPDGPAQRICHMVHDNIRSYPKEYLRPAFDALNQLGSIPWKINAPVLDVVTEVFRSGGCVDLDIPTPPNAEYFEPELPPDASNEKKREIYDERMRLRQEKAEMYSLWCDAMYKLSLANHFREKAFWLPHSMDFRGRVYPLSPNLHHFSSDMARSLLLFAKGEKLGPNGLDWLKIHTINLTGFKKQNTLKERLSYANEIMSDILDSTERPMEGEKWWKTSDKPWQTLATCMQIRAALESGDPKNFVCHFPVHQDGSCNGLQHYAALGRDAEGAASVNLAASDRPADVYSCVAKIVESKRAKDAENGHKLAQQLEGFVNRKVVKQTVMTTVYGVTRYGAQNQIEGRLKDLKFSIQGRAAAAKYLALLTFDSLGEMFTSTRKIQSWLTETATVISKSMTDTVEWVTPLGLPVLQPYFKLGKNPFSKGELNPRVLKDPAAFQKFVPNVLKQRNAFPPNFIHSLDSCHMMMTALFCERANITFVSVHDCFWIHPCNVNRLNKICREQFVALHSEPILEDLSKFLRNKYSSPRSEDPNSIIEIERRLLLRKLKRVPLKGDFDLREVLRSTYFFC